ncbi:TRAP transporter small permease [Ottowia sp. VDI28]|uniref:TRAP transporter small permease n=1 Tax=Ottowia sp. VDI28 TaxID=3133968 RepID=UPI003C2CC122
MKERFLQLERWTSGIAMVLACLMLAVASGLAVFQIVTRFVLEQPAEWSEVLIRFSLIWMVFLGIPMAFRQGAMVSVDALYRAMPDKLKRILDALVALAALILMIIVLWWGYDYAVRGSVQTMAGLEVLSMFWAYIAMPVGAVFAIIGIIANYLDPRRMELETAQ